MVKKQEEKSILSCFGQLSFHVGQHSAVSHQYRNLFLCPAWGSRAAVPIAEISFGSIDTPRLVQCHPLLRKYQGSLRVGTPFY